MNAMTNWGTALLARMRAFAGLGLQFGGARDLYSVFGYNKVPQFPEFLGKYLRQDIAQRVIHAPVDAIWTEPPELEGDATFNTRWAEIVEQGIWPIIRKGDVFAGIGSYSIILFGFDDGGALNQPVRKRTTGITNILYMQPYMEGNVTITEFDEDPKSARFGMPVMYSINPGEMLTSNKVAGMTYKTRSPFYAHYTRVLHLADNTLENLVYGHSRLEPVYNILDDLLKVVGGSAETYWMTGNRGMQFDVDKDVELDKNDAQDLADEIEEYQMQIRRVIRTRGVTVRNLGSDLADPKGTFNVLIAMLSATTGIPQRVLIGAEAGQLASQQDRANWADRIRERISTWATPHVLKPLLKFLDAAGVISVSGQVVKVTWPEAFKMNPLERAQTSAQMARSAVNIARTITEAKKNGYELIAIEEARSIIAPSSKMPIFSGMPDGTVPKPDPKPVATTQPGVGAGATVPTPPKK